MSKIKPVSDLRNHTEVRNEVKENNPVCWTRNGRGEYAILKSVDLDKLKATVKWLASLEVGENQVGKKDGSRQKMLKLN